MENPSYTSIFSSLSIAEIIATFLPHTFTRSEMRCRRDLENAASQTILLLSLNVTTQKLCRRIFPRSTASRSFTRRLFFVFVEHGRYYCSAGIHHPSLDPNMKSKQFGNPTSPSLFSPHTPSDPGTPRRTPIYSSFRSSVGLIPTQELSTQHPAYVRRASP